MGNIQRWGSYEIESAAAEQQQIQSAKTNSNFYKFKAGKNVIRFLPPQIGKKSPFRVVWQHSFSLNGEFRAVTCPRYEAKQPCLVCQKADQLKSSQNPADQERARDYFAKRRVFANIIDRENPDAGPMVCAFGKTVHEALVALRTDADAGGDFTHPETGFDIIVERKGAGKLDTEYKVFAARKATPLGNLDWIDQQANLENFAKVLTPDEMRDKLTGQKTPAVEQPRAVLPRTASPSRATRTVEADTVNSDITDAEDDLPF